MTLDPSKPVQTRDGRPARILCTGLARNGFPIAAAVTGGKGEYLSYHRSDGSLGAPLASAGDLINIPEKRVGYLNVYRPFPAKFPSRITASLHGTRWGADDAVAGDEEIKANRIACIRVEYEEGQFDE